MKAKQTRTGKRPVKVSGPGKSYQEKKTFFENMLTLYGRLAIREALDNPAVKPYRLHLAESNKPAPILEEIRNLAQEKGAELCFHSRDALSRISRNGRQDQGVALDVTTDGFMSHKSFSSENQPFELMAVEDITSPSNLGMIIRSVCASPLSGIIIPASGCARLDAQVMKASAGYLFKTRIYTCDKLDGCLTWFRENHDCEILGMSATGDAELGAINCDDGRSRIFVLGNESKGLSVSVLKACDRQVGVPMARGVESLNVAVIAGLIAFRSLLWTPHH